MVSGDAGVNGDHVTRPVAMAFSNESDCVTNRNLKTEENRVLGVTRKSACVTCNLALMVNFVDFVILLVESE
jgi:hypothetical protein